MYYPQYPFLSGALNYIYIYFFFFQSVPVSYWINPAERLVQNALNKWRMKLMKADNTSCIVVLIDPLGPRKLSILKKKREEQMRLVAEKKGLDNKVASELLSAKETLQKSPKKHKDGKHENVTSKTPPKSAPQNPGSPTRQVLWNDSTGGMKITTLLKAESVKFPMKPSPMHKFTDNLDDSAQLRSTCLISPLINDVNEPKHAKSAPCAGKPRSPPLLTSVSENTGRPGMATRQSPQKSPDTDRKVVKSGKSAVVGHHETRNEAHSKAQHTVSPSKETQRRGSHSHTTAQGNQPGVIDKMNMCNTARSKLIANLKSGSNKVKHENPSTKVIHNQISGSKLTQSSSVSTRVTESALHTTRSSHNNSASASTTSVISNHSQKCLQPSKQSSDNIRQAIKKIGSLNELENLLTSTDAKISLKNLNINKGVLRKKSKNLNNSNTSDGSRSSRKCNGAKSLSSRISLRLRRIRQKSLKNKGKGQVENKGFTKGVKRKIDTSADTPVVKKLRHS